MALFSLHELNASDAGVAYPLVACRFPDLSLARWAEFVNSPQRRANCGRLISLLDSRGHIHALFCYALGSPPAHAGRLHITHIASFRLAGDEIGRAIHEAIGTIARQNDCYEVVMSTWEGESAGRKPAQYSGASPAPTMLSILTAPHAPAMSS
ncbi:MAG: hypothetical protein KGM42_02755 [Hyphomicrobiales bacterium]|nr:hypothetical protein [Hyphomicrobiales bacterium]